MDDQTLQVAFQELRETLGEWLGYGRGEEAGDKEWNERQSRSITMFLKEGQSDFYFCGYEWSFNRPMIVLTLVSGANTIALPADFGGVEGSVYYSVESGTGWFPLQFGQVGRVYQAETELNAMTGPPTRICVEPVRGVTKFRGSVQQLRVFPTADQDYSVRFQCYLNPLAVTGDRPFGYGGVQHAHTILQACKAAAERNNGLGPDGPEQVDFQKKLRASIKVDTRNKPQNFGYNVDRSHERDMRGRRNPFQGVTVTINGIDPSVGVD